MKKKVIEMLLIGACCLMSFTPAKAQTFNANLAAKLQTTLDSLVALLTNTKGMSASVYAPGQGIWKGASGLSYAGVPDTPEMEFGLASNSKLFSAVTMLILAENNVLSLDDSLHEWLPAYTNVDPDITIRQLLNHTSGISDPFFTTSLLDSIKAHPTHAYTVPEVMALLGPPAYAPGAGYQYSNINYLLAGEVVRNATGFTMAQLIRDSILTPLSLDSTFYDVEEPEMGILAHRWNDGIDCNDTSRISLNTAGGPAGSLFSTCGEMAQWLRALMSGQVLSPASFAEMTNFVSSGNYGLGIAKFTFFGNECWGHGGSTLGYKSRTIHDPCMQAGVIGLSNSSPTAVDGITATLYQVLVDHLPGCGAVLSGAANVCRGESSVFFTVDTIAGATSYVWTLPSGATGVSATNSITVDFGMSAVSGDITVSGNNMYGPGAPSTFYVTVDTVPTIVNLTGGTLSADPAATSYQWVDCDNAYLPIAGETLQDFTPAATGNYAVILTAGACTDTSACTNVVVTGVKEPSEYQVTVYPNPFTETIMMDRRGASGKLDFTILNALGQVVCSGVVADHVSFETGLFPSGMYFIRFGDGTVKKMEK